MTTPRHEARARAVFALRCLLDEPPVSEDTIASVFDAVIDSLEVFDAWGEGTHTRMDEALLAAYGSPLRDRLHDRLVHEYVTRHGKRRDMVGAPIGELTWEGTEPLSSPTVQAFTTRAQRELASEDRATRVATCLRLSAAFYHSPDLSFLSAEQRDHLVQALLDAARDEASCTAASHALFWLTNARAGANRERPRDAAELPADCARRFESLVQQLAPDDAAEGAYTLLRETGVDRVSEQQDWIQHLAMIADGNLPRRRLAAPRPTGRQRDTAWMVSALLRTSSPSNAALLARALGGFGVLRDDMVPGLRFSFLNSILATARRDEALVYLGLVGGPVVAKLLIEAADTDQTADEYLNGRGLFGLLLLDDADVLGAQLRKAPPHGDLNAYACGLAGSCDPRGRALLEQIAQETTDPRVTAAARRALDSELLRP